MRWLLGMVVLLPMAFAGDKPAPPKATTPAPPKATTPPPPKATTPPLPAGMGELEVPPPPFSDGVFPCSDCHEKGAEVDRTPREMAQHDFKLEHDAEHRWCLDCHDADDRDRLRLASGDKIEFAESYRLCGQCHGDKYRDWRAGVHGRRTGSWSGHKKYLLCVSCHNPHSPRFKALKPEPPPTRPEKQR